MDPRLGLTDHRLSPAMLRQVTLVGTLVPFEKGEDVLHRLTGRAVSDSTIRRVTEQVGADLVDRHDRSEPVLPAAPEPWDFSLPDRHGRSFPGTVAYLGLDAFAVPTRKPGGVEWRMLYVGMWYSPDKEHAVYLTGFDLDQMGRQLRTYARVAGVGRADTIVALTDGGGGLERVVKQTLHDGVAFVLDWYHMAGQIQELAGLWHNHDPTAAGGWAEAAKAALWEGGGNGLLAYVRDQRLSADLSDEAADRYRRLCQFVEGNGHRLDYPTYRGRGWDVGSGPIEAGCKSMSGRLKGTGMRWCVGNTEPVAALRALYASSEQLWNAYWEHRLA